VAALPVVSIVTRKRHTAQQAGLTGKQRRLNVRDAFEVKQPSRAAGKRILLVDDVVTTGASANSCALALKKAGASYVAVLALARADRRIILIEGVGTVCDEPSAACGEPPTICAPGSRSTGALCAKAGIASVAVSAARYGVRIGYTVAEQSRGNRAHHGAAPRFGGGTSAAVAAVQHD